MSKKNFFFILFILIIIIPINGIAATIFFKDGTRLDVSEVWEEGGQIKCNLYGTVVGYPKENILKVEKNELKQTEPDIMKSDSESVDAPNLVDMPNLLKVEKNELKQTEVDAMKSNLKSADGTKCTQDGMWEFVINNAYRIAEDYATSRNPLSTFISIKKNYNFAKQYGGEFEGKYLLIITNEHGRDTSFAVLLPLFDVNKPSEGLDANKPLWKLISAKLNGQQY